MLKQLQEVLDKAHEGHKYVKDDVQYRKNEHWIIGLVGDCEDFALHCRQQLKRKGIESDLVYCKTETNEGHLVVHVEGWILDNRHVWVMRQDDLAYTWLKLGKPDGTWYEIEG